MNPLRLPLVYCFITGAGLMLTGATASNFLDVGAAFAVLVCLLVVSGNASGRFVRGMRPFLYLGGVTMLFGSLGPGPTLLRLGPLHWGWDAAKEALFFTGRMFFIGGAAMWLALTVPMAELLAFLHRLAHRLKFFGHYLRPVLLTLALALRMLPLLQVETMRLRQAFYARGGHQFGRGIRGAVRTIPLLTIPLVAASFRRAEALADAIHVRMGSANDAIMSVAGRGEARSGPFPLGEKVRLALLPLLAWSWLVARFLFWAGEWLIHA